MTRHLQVPDGEIKAVGHAPSHAPSCTPSPTPFTKPRTKLHTIHQAPSCTHMLCLCDVLQVRCTFGVTVAHATTNTRTASLSRARLWRRTRQLLLSLSNTHTHAHMYTDVPCSISPAADSCSMPDEPHVCLLLRFLAAVKGPGGVTATRLQRRASST